MGWRDRRRVALFRPAFERRAHFAWRACRADSHGDRLGMREACSNGSGRGRIVMRSSADCAKVADRPQAVCYEWLVSGRVAPVLLEVSRMHLVRIDRDRPDFRVFIDLLFGRGWNVDTEGNSHPVNSRTWTSLYIADRTGGEPPVTIEASDDDPQVFQVESASARLEALAALYLFLRSGATIVAPEGALDGNQRLALQARYSAELQRAADALWHQSSDSDPYPNLTAIRR